MILQNSLVGYLDAFVDGIDKDRVIQEVRESIESIAKLAPHYRNLVVKAYASSLRVTFIATVVIGLIGFLVIVPIRLPRLPQQRKMKKQLGRV